MTIDDRFYVFVCIVYRVSCIIWCMVFELNFSQQPIDTNLLPSSLHLHPTCIMHHAPFNYDENDEM